MAAHKHSWRYSPGAEHRACECGAEQTLQAKQDTCGLRHWGPMNEPRRAVRDGANTCGADVVVRLRNACNGRTAVIPWPHRLLHEAADKIEQLRAEVARFAESNRQRGPSMGYGEEGDAWRRYVNEKRVKEGSSVNESLHAVNERQRQQDRKQNTLRRRFESLLGDGYDPGWLEPMTASAALIDEQAAIILTLREQIAALESRKVCTVAHDNVETCGYCQRDALLSRAKGSL